MSDIEDLTTAINALTRLRDRMKARVVESHRKVKEEKGRDWMLDFGRSDKAKPLIKFKLQSIELYGDVSVDKIYIDNKGFDLSDYTGQVIEGVTVARRVFTVAGEIKSSKRRIIHLDDPRGDLLCLSYEEITIFRRGDGDVVIHGKAWAGA